MYVISSFYGCSAHSYFVFFRIASCHCLFVIYEYYTYPVTTSYGQMPPNRDGKFPDITLCNLNPIAHKTSQVSGNQDFLNIAQYAALIAGCQDCPDAVGGVPFRDIFLNTNAYFQNIGRKQAEKLGHQWNDFIVDCYVEINDGFWSEFIPCERILNATLITYSSLFNCFSLKTHSTNLSEYITGYKLSFHLDNYDGDSRKHFASPNDFSLTEGVVIMAHPWGTKAWLQESAIFLHPGMAIDLRLRVNSVKRMGPPHGDCVYRTKLQHNDEWMYSQGSCLSACLEKVVLKVSSTYTI